MMKILLLISVKVALILMAKLNLKIFKFHQYKLANLDI